MLGRTSLIQAEHLARRVVELVMVDFDVRKGSIELDVYIALPGGELEGRHGGGLVDDATESEVYDYVIYKGGSGGRLGVTGASAGAGAGAGAGGGGYKAGHV